MKVNEKPRQAIWRRPNDAIRIFGISMATLYRWLADGTVATKKISGCRFVDVSEFLTLEPSPDPDPAELLAHAAKVEEEGRQAHKHAQEIERFVALREAKEQSTWDDKVQSFQKLIEAAKSNREEASK